MVKVEIESPKKRYITCEHCGSVLSFLKSDAINNPYDVSREINCPACKEIVKVEKYLREKGEMKRLWRESL